MRNILSYLTILLVLPALLKAQAVGDLKLIDWRPVSQLVVKETKILKPRYPVIDVHNHLALFCGGNSCVGKYLEEMDKAGVWKCISLDGFSRIDGIWKDYIKKGPFEDFYKGHLKALHSVSRERFPVFYVPAYDKINEPDFGIKEAKRLEEAVKMGVRGLKIHKLLGLDLKDKDGKVIPVDDPRFDPVWAKCGELGIPVVVHVSDPKAFFTPFDKDNERYDELVENPDWSFAGEEYPSKEEILAQRNRVFARHPQTIFIGAHLGTLPEELHRVGNWLDVYPNLYVDLDARISELGRQPYTARKFMIKYQDRV
ncbi:amidohydrolase family protein, partial [Gemmatimonadota bacterium]